MIALDPSDVARLDRASKATKDREAAAAAAAVTAAGAEALAKVSGKKRRGIRKALKRAANIVTEQRLALLDELKARKADAAAAARGANGGGGGGAAAGESVKPAKATTMELL